MTFAIEIPGDDSAEYGWSLSENPEIVNGEVVGIARTILAAWANNGEPCTVYAGLKTAPVVSFNGIAEEVRDRVAEILYEQVGEVAGNFDMTEAELLALAASIRSVIEPIGYSCWLCADMRPYDATTPEYQRALAVWESPEMQATKEGL